MTIYLLRHGQSEGNRAAVFSGVMDHGLTDLGRQQAREVGTVFAGRRFSLVVSSKLSRAIETADLVLAAAGAGLGERIALAELNERNFGVYEGVAEAASADVAPADPRRRIQSDIDFSPPGGESMRQTHDRAVAFLQDYLFPRAATGDILVVGHGNVLRSMTLHYLGWPIDLLPAMPSRNCLVTRLVAPLLAAE
jgi:2,3-bisphosphoglycerate-dependent phosphoglycerate mutase